MKLKKPKHISSDLILYRYEEEIKPFGGLDAFENYICCGTSVDLILKEFKVIKETPKGYWLDIPYWEPRWVKKDSLGAKRKFAWETKEAALQNFIRRKDYQIGELEKRIDNLKRALNLAKLEYNKFFEENYEHRDSLGKQEHSRSAGCKKQKY